ncbi:815_t:CDS:2, partial [Rhizophagus irregularis]
SNNTFLESLLEGQGEGTNDKSKVCMTHLWRIYVAATSGVCVGGLDLVDIADIKSTRDIDDVLSFTDHTLANISREPTLLFRGYRWFWL